MMSSLRSSRSERGAGIVEMVFAMIVAGIVLAGLVGMLIQQHRFYLIANDASQVSGLLHRMETALSPEFFPLNSDAQDIIYAGADSVALRAFRGVYSVCDKRLNVDVFLTVRSLTAVGSIGSDSALVYSKGTKASITDDHWKVVDIQSVTADVCPDGTSGWTLLAPDLNGLLSQIPIGASVRAFRHGSYALVKQDGFWTLKSDALGASNVVGGRLAPDDSAAASIFQFRYFDAAGNPTSVLTEIARVGISVTALGRVPVRPTNDPISRRRTLSIGLRNAGL